MDVEVGVGVSVTSGGRVAVVVGTGECMAVGMSVIPNSGVAEGVTVGMGTGDGVGVEVGSDGVALGKVGMGVGVMVMAGSLRGGRVGRGSQEPDGLLPGDGTPEETAGMGADAAPAT